MVVGADVDVRVNAPEYVLDTFEDRDTTTHGSIRPVCIDSECKERTCRGSAGYIIQRRWIVRHTNNMRSRPDLLALIYALIQFK